MTEAIIEESQTTKNSRKKPTAKKTVYKWAPTWHTLDEEDLVRFFCMIDITISQKQYDDKELRHRLKRQFTKTKKGWKFTGTIASLEYEDTTQLSTYLKVTIPQEIVEQSNFPVRLFHHLVKNEKSGDYDWKPVQRLLDEEMTPLIVAHFDCELFQYDYDKLPNSMKTHLRRL